VEDSGDGGAQPGGARPAAGPEGAGSLPPLRPEGAWELLQAAGFERWEIESRAFAFEYDGPEHYWQVVSEMTAPLRNRMATLDDAGREKLRSLVVDEAKKVDIGNRVVYNATTLCVWAE
jgi:hypothetical protein